MPTPKPEIIVVEPGADPAPTAPVVTQTAPSNFASRRRDREAAEAAAGGPPEKRRMLSLRAGADAENPLLVVSHVRQ